MAGRWSRSVPSGEEDDEDDDDGAPVASGSSPADSDDAVAAPAEGADGLDDTEPGGEQHDGGDHTGADPAHDVGLTAHGAARRRTR